jgi:transporter family protein
MSWLVASMITVLLWGVVGLLQKMGSNHATSNSLFVWTTVGYALLLPFLIADSHLLSLPARSIFVGLVCGVTNALGAWALYTALERGARASVAVPLTALYPVVTLVLALIVLGERLTKLQTAGVVLALAAGVLLSYESEAS